jgi:hypothetical protein
MRLHVAACQKTVIFTDCHCSTHFSNAEGYVLRKWRVVWIRIGRTVLFAMNGETGTRMWKVEVNKQKNHKYRPNVMLFIYEQTVQCIIRNPVFAVSVQYKTLAFGYEPCRILLRRPTLDISQLCRSTNQLDHIQHSAHSLPYVRRP